MILLDKNNYDKVTEPLKAVKVNHLFARSVAEEQVIGTIYVDNPDNPTTFYIVHPYGMSLLFGDIDHHDFNSHLLDYLLNTSKVRDKVEWLQAYPDSWNIKLAALVGEKLIKSHDNDGNKFHDNNPPHLNCIKFV